MQPAETISSGAQADSLPYSGNFWGGVAQRKYKVALVFGTILVIATAIIFALPCNYRSQAQLLIRLGRENVAVDPTATFGQTPAVSVPQSLDNEINSAVVVLKSQVVAENVVDAIGPRVILGKAPYSEASAADSDGSPSESSIPPATAEERRRAVARLTRSLDVEAVKKTNIILITYEAPSPELARAVVSKVIDFHVDRHLSLNRAPKAPQFLRDQMGLLRSRLAGTEKELLDLKNETGLSAPEVQRQINVTRIGKLQEVLAEATCTQAAVQAELKVYRKNLSGPAQTHDRVYEETKLSLVKQEAALASLDAKIEALKTHIAEEQEQLRTFNKDGLHIAQLQRELELQETSYRKHAESLEQTHIDQALQVERISNIGIAQPATYEPEPMRARRWLLLALGSVLALGCSLGLAVALNQWDQMARRP